MGPRDAGERRTEGEGTRTLAGDERGSAADGGLPGDGVQRPASICRREGCALWYCASPPWNSSQPARSGTQCSTARFGPERHLLVDVEEPAHFEPEVRKREKARMAILFGTATAVLQQQARRLPKCQWPTYRIEQTHGLLLSLRYETRLVGPPPKPILILIESPPFGR